jgi:hypothetical protein
MQQAVLSITNDMFQAGSQTPLATKVVFPSVL